MHAVAVVVRVLVNFPQVVCVCSVSYSHGNRVAANYYKECCRETHTLTHTHTNTQTNKQTNTTQTAIEGRVKELRETAATEDVEGMKKGIEALQQEVMKMGRAMYAQPGVCGVRDGKSFADEYKG